MTRVAAFLAVLLVTALPTSLPELTGRVVDLANVLSPETEASLTEQLAAHEQRTSNQVVVATVSSLQGYDIERFANELFRAWGLGSPAAVAPEAAALPVIGEYFSRQAE
jgi:uncharacterized protein